MSIFIPSKLENHKRLSINNIKRAHFKPMIELESGHIVSVMIDDSINKHYEEKLPRIRE